MAHAAEVLAHWGSLLAANEGAAQAPPVMEQLFRSPLILIFGVMFLFYFIILRPEQRRKAEEAKLISMVKKNDRIITAGGIHATVVAAAPDNPVVTIKIDESGNTRVKLNRSSIATIISDKSKEADKTKESEDKFASSKVLASEAKDK